MGFDEKNEGTITDDLMMVAILSIADSLKKISDAIPIDNLPLTGQKEGCLDCKYRFCIQNAEPCRSCRRGYLDRYDKEVKDADKNN